MYHFRRRHGYGRPVRVGRTGRTESDRNERHGRNLLGYSNNVRFWFYANDRDNRVTRRRDWDGAIRDAQPPLPREPTAPAPDAETLQVKGIDLLIASNTKLHHTDEYDVTKGIDGMLVVRRGQSFDIRLTLNRAYDARYDDLRLIFEAGAQPQKSKGTLVEFFLSAEDKRNQWGAKILSQKGHELTLHIFTPPTLMVGKWEINIDVIKKTGGNEDRYRYTHDDEIIIIFNPWCRDDSVYLEKEDHCQEYVMEESGRIFSGTAKQITAKPWVFGQFEAGVLDTALFLMDFGGMNWSARGNPITIVRKISALMNSNDDGGVLVGKWTGEYSDGTSPLSWTGSVDILKEFRQTKRPVKYGQCWVFSAVTTTVLRALGIPARSVTNFASAHDTDGSITIDFHYNAEGEPDKSQDTDSVWNFHVWNECWMARPDLPEGYGGWQAIDSTPQEASDDVYCCGPAPLSAIKQGNVNLPYDSPFVFAEVNADTVYWIETNDGYKVAGMNKNSVGKFISTKAIKSNDRDDVTHLYKAEEGSAAERAAVMKANQVGSNREDIYEKGVEDVLFRIEDGADNSWLGEDFKVALSYVNNSKETRTVNGRIVIKSMFYTGVTDEVIKSIPFKNVVLAPGGSGFKPVTCTEDDYGKALKDCCMFDVNFWANVSETKQTFTEKESYRLRKPHLTTKAPKEAKKNNEFPIEVSFTNPLRTQLTYCTVEVNGLAKAVKFPQKNVKAKSTFTTTVHVTPTKIGHKELVILFNSRELEDINAAHAVFIKE